MTESDSRGAGVETTPSDRPAWWVDAAGDAPATVPAPPGAATDRPVFVDPGTGTAAPDGTDRIELAGTATAATTTPTLRGTVRGVGRPGAPPISRGPSEARDLGGAAAFEALCRDLGLRRRPLLVAVAGTPATYAWVGIDRPVALLTGSDPVAGTAIGDGGAEGVVESPWAITNSDTAGADRPVYGAVGAVLDELETTASAAREAAIRGPPETERADGG